MFDRVLNILCQSRQFFGNEKINFPDAKSEKLFFYKKLLLFKRGYLVNDNENDAENEK